MGGISYPTRSELASRKRCEWNARLKSKLKTELSNVQARLRRESVRAKELIGKNSASLRRSLQEHQRLLSEQQRILCRAAAYFRSSPSGRIRRLGRAACYMY